MSRWVHFWGGFGEFAVFLQADLSHWRELHLIACSEIWLSGKYGANQAIPCPEVISLCMVGVGKGSHGELQSGQKAWANETGYPFKFMEILLITDTYLSSVPFGSKVIKTNNESQWWKSKQDQGKWSSQEKLWSALNRAWPWATGPH